MAPSSSSSSSTKSSSASRHVKFDDSAANNRKTRSATLASRNAEAALAAQRHKERIDLMNDVDCLYPQLSTLPPEQVRKFKEFLLRPASLSPVPSHDDVLKSPLREYYYGFYISEDDIRNFAIEHNTARYESKHTTFQDMMFMPHFLSQLMERRDVKIHDVIVSEWHKKNIPGVVEEVGKKAYCLMVLSWHEHRAGYNPTNRELRVLAYGLEQKPCWWKAAD